MVRVALGLILIAANGFVAFGIWFSFLYWEAPPSVADGIGIGLAAFVGAAAIEALAILLVLGATKLIRRLWRQADHACTSYEP